MKLPDFKPVAKPRIVIAVNTAWYLYNFRTGLIRALMQDGYEVVTLARADEYSEKIAQLGCRYVPFHIDYKGTDAVRDVWLLLRYYRLLRRERPAALITYTVKPNVFASIASHLLGIPVINNVGGLGTAFMRVNWVTRLVRFLYRLAFSRSYRVFFQNDEDMRVFLSDRIVSGVQASRVPGSGVDVRAFSPAAVPNGVRRPFRFLLPARLLWDKGVGEFVAAARTLRRENASAEFYIAGFINEEDPTSVRHANIDEWTTEGVITYIGAVEDVRRHFAAADCIVLPSYYREGVPRALLEAASMARPIITTDNIGCREVVDDGVNGFLCRPRDVADLTDKMRRIMTLSEQDREIMGTKGRAKVLAHFDEQIVIARYRETLAQLARLST